MSSLTTLDHNLFHKINQRWTAPFLDVLMPFITDFRNTWWIILAICLVWIGLQRGRAFKALLGCALSVVVSDAFNSRIIKQIFIRDRPPEIFAAGDVTVRTHYHSGYSFASTHAANAFSAATYIALVEPAAAPYVFPVAFLIAYSRVYVGVHFPADVIGGALIGVFCAILIDTLIKLTLGIRRKKKNQLPQ